MNGLFLIFLICSLILKRPNETIKYSSGCFFCFFFNIIYWAEGLSLLDRAANAKVLGSILGFMTCVIRMIAQLGVLCGRPAHPAITSANDRVVK